MLVFEHGAFGCTSITNSPADVTDIFGFGVIHAHRLNGEITHICTESQHFDAFFPGLGVWFMQAGVKAFITCLQAFLASINTSLVTGNVGLSCCHQSFSFYFLIVTLSKLFP